MQSAKHSFIESCTNTASACFISWLVQAFLIPVIWPSVQASPTEAIGIVAVFTVIAIIRNFFWRRIFNWYHVRANSTWHKYGHEPHCNILHPSAPCEYNCKARYEERTYVLMEEEHQQDADIVRYEETRNDNRR